jgi:hypothetical protein
MANVTNGSRLSTTINEDPLETVDAASAAQLSRIADSLDVIIRMIREDQEENKKRWEKETIGE